jgi:LytS/YehU family sensor histidine kinase
MDTNRHPALHELRHAWRHWLSGTSAATPPLWVQLVWTVGFSAAIALGFALLNFISTANTIGMWLDPRRWAVVYGQNLVVALIIGFIIQALYRLAFSALGGPRIAALQGWRRTLFFSGIPLLGTAIGWPIGMTVLFGDLRMFSGMTSGNVMSVVVLALMISYGFHTYFSLRARRIQAEMRATEAQLRLLQGQMEPHFLFNTLANVISLIDADAPRAKQMLEALTDYLRVSLTGLRDGDSTLAQELELARRYLQLMQTRMGERLRFEIAVDATVAQARLMPLVLQPLVENAVKHGLEPQVDGGTVRVEATRVVVDGTDSLQVCVEDDGAGLAAAARRPRRRVAGGADGNGIALANLRERLQSRFGPGARLTLTERDGEPGGTRACLLLPWDAASAR